MITAFTSICLLFDSLSTSHPRVGNSSVVHVFFLENIRHNIKAKKFFFFVEAESSLFCFCKIALESDLSGLSNVFMPSCCSSSQGLGTGIFLFSKISVISLLQPSLFSVWRRVRILASRKRRRKGNSVVSDETVMYDYESSATLSIDRLHYNLQTRSLVREGAPRWRTK
jgi:hypothetical protein